MLHARIDYMRIQDPAGLIPEDEPVFLLRAQDRTASKAVLFWATMQNTGILGQLLFAFIVWICALSTKLRNPGKPAGLAALHAKAMEAWPVKKTADVPDIEEDPKEA